LLRLTRLSYERLILNAEADIDQRYLDFLRSQIGDEEPFFLSGAILLAVLGESRTSQMTDHPEFGSMVIKPSARIEIVDGLHRIAALHELRTGSNRIKDASIAVQISASTGLSKIIEGRKQATKRNRRMTSRRRVNGAPREMKAHERR